MRRDPKSGSYMIGVVAARYEIHPQTLRLYEREGLLLPSRTEGKTRLYSEDDLERLEFILSLTRDLGVNLAGVEVVLNLRDRMKKMQEEMQNIIEKNESKMKSAGLEPERGLEGISSTGLVKLTPQGLRKR
ncbi:MerR family transcriptional regulator [Mesoterricola silvestris]|uniref:MerR family transcriptional regulator n=1 Tax=Mesoterricola silvestris TaxID=2927979 RepID=A0AA48H302_9BACT|nr:helix-turn-helix transcriptional regulator [Mesoterricola silvestris]BDU70983.1 MerR family transcriptional regulator [Mesoterricola silvestris]